MCGTRISLGVEIKIYPDRGSVELLYHGTRSPSISFMRIQKPVGDEEQDHGSFGFAGLGLPCDLSVGSNAGSSFGFSGDVGSGVWDLSLASFSF